MAGTGIASNPQDECCLPSFFVIGPPRTGTSWLHEVLRQNAWLADPIKETRFFDRHFHHGLEWYRAHYRRIAGDRPVGEIAPTYFASAEARERIARLIPQARVVCTFRNPVERVISLYRLKRAYGLIPWSFEQALTLDPELMESSRYLHHLKAWQQTLGRGQVLSTVYDDLRIDPQGFIDQIAEFVGVQRFVLLPRQIRYVLTSEAMTQPRNYYWTRGAALLSEWSRARRMGTMVAAAKILGLHKLFLGGGPAFPELSREKLAELYEFFRPEVEQLEIVLQRDLSSWKHPPVEEHASGLRRSLAMAG
jgi:hypothetical protein